MYHVRSSSLNHHLTHDSTSSSVYSLRTSSISNRSSALNSQEPGSTKIQTSTASKVREDSFSNHREELARNPYAESFWTQCYGEEGEDEMRKRVVEKPQIDDKACSWYSYQNKELPKIHESFQDLEISYTEPQPKTKRKLRKILFDGDSLLTDFPTPLTPDERSAVPLLIQNVLESEEKYRNSLDDIEELYKSFIFYTNENNVILRKQETLLMFGNFTTLMELSDRFHNDLRQEIEYSRHNLKQRLFQSLEDHINRIFIVYESYILVMKERVDYWSDVVFKKSYLREWVESIVSIELRPDYLEELLQTPIRRLIQYYTLIETECKDHPSQELINCLISIGKLLDLKNQKQQRQKQCFSRPYSESPTILKVPLAIETGKKKQTNKPTLLLNHCINRFRSNHDLYLHCNKQITRIIHLHQVENHASLRIAEIFTDFDSIEQGPDSKFVVKKAIDSPLINSTPRSSLYVSHYISSAYEIYSDKLKLQTDKIRQLIDDFERWIRNLHSTMSELYKRWDSDITQQFLIFKQMNRVMDREIKCVKLSEEQIEFIFKLQKLSALYNSLIYIIVFKLITFERGINSITSFSSNETSETVSNDEIIGNFKYLKTLNRRLLVDCAKDDQKYNLFNRPSIWSKQE